jgi:hypothetical protein
MTWLFVFLLVVAAFLVVMGFWPKQKLKRWRVRWQYENPDAVVWSDSYVALSRVVAFIGAGILVATALMLRADRSEVRSAADSAAVDLARGTQGDDAILSSQSVVYEAVRKAGEVPLNVEHRGSDGSGSDRYEITNILGQYPVCLTVIPDLTLDGFRLEPTVTDGPC